VLSEEEAEQWIKKKKETFVPNLPDNLWDF